MIFVSTVSGDLQQSAIFEGPVAADTPMYGDLGEHAGLLQVPIHNRVGGAVGEGENCRRGNGRALIRERETAEDEQVRQLPVLQIGAYYAAFGRSGHDGAALDLRQIEVSFTLPVLRPVRAAVRIETPIIRRNPGLIEGRLDSFGEAGRKGGRRLHFHFI
jgi:hypothetical protein